MAIINVSSLVRAYASIEVEARVVHMRWHRGMGIRLWGENGCAPVAITCDDGSEGLLDYAFGEDADRGALA